VADRWALVVATDSHLDPALPPVAYAEAGAKQLAAGLAAAGFAADRTILLTGKHATKAVVESRLRRLLADAGTDDLVLVHLTGATLDGFLAVADTLADDLAGTAVHPESLLARLAEARTGQAVLLLEAGDGLDHEAVRSACVGSPKLVCLTAGGEDDEPLSAAAVRAPVWTHLLAEGFAGQLATAADRAGRLTAASLQRAVEAEVPRLLRRHLEPGLTQTPHLYGEANAGLVLADQLARPPADLSLDPARLKRVAFRADSRGRVKDLTDWRKTFTVPDNAGSRNRKFVQRVATADLRADLDAVYAACREHLGLKRKDLEVTVGEDGFGSLRTPDFEYTVAVGLDPDAPDGVTWRREAGRFADPAFVTGDGFDALFGKLFDELVFEFASPVDVERLIDRLEDRPPKGLRVQAASGGDSCEVTLAGFVGRVTVTRDALSVRGRPGDPGGLLEQFLKFLKAVGPLGEPAALPPGR
jgi:hypothetical protein